MSSRQICVSCDRKVLVGKGNNSVTVSLMITPLFTHPTELSRRLAEPKWLGVIQIEIESVVKADPEGASLVLKL